MVMEKIKGHELRKEEVDDKIDAKYEGWGDVKLESIEGYNEGNLSKGKNVGFESKGNTVG